MKGSIRADIIHITLLINIIFNYVCGKNDDS